MPMISRRILNQELEKYILTLFAKTISDLEELNDIQIFIEDLLSPTERIMLAKRLAIAILLQKGYTYAEIDQTLKVSSPTINKVAFWLRHGKSGYQKAIKRILDNQKKEKLIDKIEEILLQLSPPKMYGSIGFQEKQKRGKELLKRRIKRDIL